MLRREARGLFRLRLLNLHDQLAAAEHRCGVRPDLRPDGDIGLIVEARIHTRIRFYQDAVTRPDELAHTLRCKADTGFLFLDFGWNANAHEASPWERSNPIPSLSGNFQPSLVSSATR